MITIFSAIMCLVAALLAVILGFVAIGAGVVPFIGKVFRGIFGRR